MEALAHITRGLELLQTLPDTPERAQHELMLQTTLGVALIATRGYAAPEVGKAYTRARELCQQVGETPHLFPILGGLWQFYLMRAEYQTVRELGELLLTLAQNVQDPAVLVTAHDALGQSFFCLGEFGQAQAHLDQSILRYDPQHHRTLTFLCGGEDPGVACRGFAAWTLWSLGYPDRALERIHEALSLAGEIAHPFSLAHALTFTVGVHLFRGERRAAQERAAALMTLSSEQGFAYFLAFGTLLWGWALAEQGQGGEGIAQMRQGMDAARTTGAEGMRSLFFALLAEACGKVGQTEEGLSTLAEALALVDKTGERYYEAELYRLKGALTLQEANQKSKSKSQKSKVETNPQPLAPKLPGEVEQEAEGYFLKAIVITRRQQAKSLELRTVMSLARLWQSQGKKTEAHHLLSEIYGWFTEGFDTKDLQEAKELLAELNH